MGRASASSAPTTPTAGQAQRGGPASRPIRSTSVNSAVAAAISMPLVPSTEPMNSTMGDAASSTPATESGPAGPFHAAAMATASSPATRAAVTARPV